MSGTDRGLFLRSVRLTLGRRTILDGIDLDVPAGRITGLAGESGSGKTVTGMTVVGLQPTGSRVSGAIELASERAGRLDLRTLSPRRLNRLRGREVGVVFQDPTASLHPMLSIGSQVTDGMRHHLRLDRRAARARAIDLLERVRVPEPEAALARYPHQFSGGQLQRIAIAIAIACDPAVLIADEPTTALDVTVQAGVLRLLRELCDDLELAVLLVTHDLGVMSAVADTIAVMRQGVIVEHGERYQVIREPVSEYTRALVDALPHVEPPVRAVGESPVGDGSEPISPADPAGFDRPSDDSPTEGGIR